MREWGRMTTWEGTLGFDVAIFQRLERRNNCSEVQQEIRGFHSSISLPNNSYLKETNSCYFCESTLLLGNRLLK